MSSSRQQWTCPRCTLRNRGATCDACQGPRPPRKGAKGLQNESDTMKVFNVLIVLADKDAKSWKCKLSSKAQASDLYKLIAGKIFIKSKDLRKSINKSYVIEFGYPPVVIDFAPNRLLSRSLSFSDDEPNVIKLIPRSEWKAKSGSHRGPGRPRLRRLSSVPELRVDDGDSKKSVEELGDWGSDNGGWDTVGADGSVGYADPGGEWGSAGGDSWGSSGDSWGMNEEPGSSSPAPTEGKESTDKGKVATVGSAETLTRYDVVDLRQGMINSVRSSLELPEDVCVLLLQHVRWSTVDLMSHWFDNREQVCKEAHIHPSVLQKKSKSGNVRPDDEMTCTLCFSECTGKDWFALPCEHGFCSDCWTEWVLAKCEAGTGAVLRTTCMQQSCSLVLPVSQVLRFLEQHPKPRSMVVQHMVEEFVDANNTLAWCTNPRCDRVLRLIEGGQEDVECECGTEFCFACHEEPHMPCPCALLLQWQEKMSSDKTNTQWIRANSKRCPKCQVFIEKNEGCMHMTCSRCRHEFCWLCRGNWSTHGQTTGGFYACNIYKGTAASSDDAKRSQLRKSVERWTHFFSRHDRHRAAMNSLIAHRRRMEPDLWRLVEERHIQSARNFTSLLDACDSLIEAHRMLMWSYVLVYFLPLRVSKNKRRRKPLFSKDAASNEEMRARVETDQGRLEMMAEKLHVLLTRNNIYQLIKRKSDVQQVAELLEKATDNVATGIMAGRWGHAHLFT